MLTTSPAASSCCLLFLLAPILSLLSLQGSPPLLTWAINAQTSKLLTIATLGCDYITMEEVRLVSTTMGQPVPLSLEPDSLSSRAKCWWLPGGLVLTDTGCWGVHSSSTPVPGSLSRKHSSQ
ncbi:hypothetical protein HHUSO_G16156 [Huso huso]|uniref:Uncharacterized protein n=1 Tax=Huso huso TaxID=61971 RepID=A0ABR0ZAC7_HUSHU